MKNITLEAINHIEIVSSNGYGKSIYIEKELEKEVEEESKKGRYQYIPFPFEGEVKKYMRRLKDLKIN